MNKNNITDNQSGFTLVGLMVGLGVMTVLALAVTFAIINIKKVQIGTNANQEQLEIISEIMKITNNPTVCRDELSVDTFDLATNSELVIDYTFPKLNKFQNPVLSLQKIREVSSSGSERVFLASLVLNLTDEDTGGIFIKNIGSIFYRTNLTSVLTCSSFAPE